MKKTNCNVTTLDKGKIAEYNFGEINLFAYKTNDPIDDEVFVVEKKGKGVVVEMPCFYDNILELTKFLQQRNIEIVAKLVAYHGAGASFLPNVAVVGTESAKEYNSVGGGAALVSNFAQAFGAAFDSSLCRYTTIVADGVVRIADIEFVVSSNHEAFDIEIPQINCVYTHMMGHDCHSIVAGNTHADAIINQLEEYINKGYDLILTSHYTPEDLKDAETKIAYLRELKKIAASCRSAEEMKAKVEKEFSDYGGANYLDMTVGMFFPQK